MPPKRLGWASGHHSSSRIVWRGLCRQPHLIIRHPTQLRLLLHKVWEGEGRHAIEAEIVVCEEAELRATAALCARVQSR